MAAAAPMPPIIDLARRIDTDVGRWTIRRTVARYANPEDDDYDYEHTRLRVPRYQRKWSWNAARGLDKMRRLIDSILHGYPIPAIILNHTVRDGNDYWDIYDGRHRIETVWRFFNNRFTLHLMDGRTVYYRDLHPIDQERFCNFEFATIITENAPEDQLAEVFIRLNSGSSLKDKDLCWANRNKPLVDATVHTLTANADRLRGIFGPKVNLSTASDLRPRLHNWVGLINGLNNRSASMMTSSYIRLSSHLDDPINQDAIDEGIDLICTLYERANLRYPETNATHLQKNASLGHVIAFFYQYIMYLPDGETPRPFEHREEVIHRWVDVIGHIRSYPDSPLLVTTGPQNLNHRKVSAVVRRVEDWFNGNEIAGVPASFQGGDSDSSNDYGTDNDEEDDA